MGFNTKLIFALSFFTHNCCNSSNYKQYDLVKACHNQELSVGQGNRSSILVTHTNLDWNGKKDFECVFYVRTNFEMGLFAVIQKMALRRNKDTTQCIDFVKFRPAKKRKLMSNWVAFNNNKDTPWTSQICGIVDNSGYQLTAGAEAVATSKETDLIPHAFQNSDGDIEIKLHISKENYPPKDLQLQIAFTSYKDCKTDIGAYKKCGHNTCIYKEYFEDEIVNCPFIKSCDEPHCPDFVTDPDAPSGFGRNVTITAVSSIFLSFFLFLGCILLCRHMDSFVCWNGTSSRDRGTELSQVEPTAPPVPSPDKDLPPAYETLFPEGRQLDT